MVATFALPAPAGADDLIFIPVSGFAQGSEGDVVSIASVAVPEDVVGATCQITGSTVNQISVHEGNDLLIITGGQTFVVPNFEDAGFIVHEAGTTAAVGSTIELQVRFGPDGVSSGGFRVSIDCEVATTTTEPATTTTVDAPTTTTEEPPAGPTTATTAAPTPPSSDVEANPPSTTEEPPAGPTTVTPTTATPTTATPTTDAPPAGPSAGDDGSLPVTGSSTGLIVGLGVVFVVSGAVLRRLSSVTA